MKTKVSITVALTLFLSVLISCNSSTKNTTITETSVSTGIQDNTNKYSSKMTKADKKKYYNNNNTVVYEIKYKSDGFKLRTAASDLIWKVKLYDNKVKISDNEENLNPYEIKMTDTYKAKLVKDDVALARTTYDLNAKQQSIASENDAQPEFFETSYSPSLLLTKIPGIALDQKDILIEELKSKGY
ncbi:hypothetical protein [Olleya namhaensis]|uniref:Lipoprotein n=1 Tax=Olleya namhaensis TaxID=1144750 RepID=A0A1I3R1B3_9FLAO|nr:hypothetical protein [Olleya namhaensis]SFJ39925.1 hypothetical protein SAMN05443431_10759 [Olleya namhaensis]